MGTICLDDSVASKPAAPAAAAKPADGSAPGHTSKKALIGTILTFVGLGTAAGGVALFAVGMDLLHAKHSGGGDVGPSPEEVGSALGGTVLAIGGASSGILGTAATVTGIVLWVGGSAEQGRAQHAGRITRGAVGPAAASWPRAAGAALRVRW